MVKQKALLLLGQHRGFAVSEVDIPSPEAGEILVEIQSAGLNPVDWKIEERGFGIKEYPAVIGSDGAGIIKELGEGVTTFEVGDRVFYQGWSGNRHGTFQQYAIAPADFAAKIPPNLTFDQAATLPVALATANFGLYGHKFTPPQPGGLELTPFWAEGGRGKYAGQPIVIVNGAGAAGQQAIQSARVSGFSPIIATASPRNAAYLESLGATHVIDRSAPLLPAVRAITSLPVTVAFDAISTEETQNALWDVLAPDGRVLFFPPISVEKEKFEKGKAEEGKVAAFSYGSTSVPAHRELGAQLYRNLTAILASGDLKPNRVEVLPNGLAGITHGLERLKTGKVSALKLVVHPQETA